MRYHWWEPVQMRKKRDRAGVVSKVVRVVATRKSRMINGPESKIVVFAQQGTDGRQVIVAIEDARQTSVEVVIREWRPRIDSNESMTRQYQFLPQCFERPFSPRNNRTHHPQRFILHPRPLMRQHQISSRSLLVCQRFFTIRDQPVDLCQDRQQFAKRSIDFGLAGVATCDSQSASTVGRVKEEAADGSKEATSFVEASASMGWKDAVEKGDAVGEFRVGGKRDGAEVDLSKYEKGIVRDDASE